MVWVYCVFFSVLGERDQANKSSVSGNGFKGIAVGVLRKFSWYLLTILYSLAAVVEVYAVPG